jgi:hypothetical protein
MVTRRTGHAKSDDPSYVRTQCFAVGISAVPQYHRSRDCFHPFRVGCAECRCFEDIWMLVELFLELAARYVFAAGLDHVIYSVNECQTAFRRHHAEIT